MNDLIEKVLDLVKKRNSFDKKNPFYVNPEKYLERLYNEINEVKDELKEKNSVFLEDEI
jgi:mazG-related protein